MASKRTTKAAKAKTVKEAVKPEEVKVQETAVKEAVEVQEKKEEMETVQTAAEDIACRNETEVKNELHIQFAGKAYSYEKLMNIAKDVWKYDLNQSLEDLKEIQLYVKPEENVVYYVMNHEIRGNFNI